MITTVPAHTHSVDPPSTATTTVADHLHAIDPPNTTSTSTAIAHTHDLTHTHAVDPPSTATTTIPAHNHANGVYSQLMKSDCTETISPACDYTCGEPHIKSSAPLLDANAHSHTVDIASFNSGGASVAATGSGGPAHTHDVNVASFNAGNAGTHAHNVDIAPVTSTSTGTSSVDVTMPYLQLLICRKD